MRPFGDSVGPTETQHGEHCFERSVKIAVKTSVWMISDWPAMSSISKPYDFNLGRSCSQMGPSWGQVAPSWSQVAPSWSQVGPKLERTGSKLGRSWGLAGRSWPQVRSMLRTCWIETAHLDDFGPICKMCKLPKRGTAFWRLARANMPPQMRLYQSERSVRLLPLLSYHASASSAPADLI